MTTQDQKQLAKTLWDIADKLRGAMSADDFRDYMLSFLFLRYISDNYENAAKKELHFDSTSTQTLLDWYKSNPDDTAEFEAMLKQSLHYSIQPDFLWSNITELARVHDKDLLNTLMRAFKYIEEESFQSTFRGLFSEINLSSEKLGRDYTERNTKLCTIISQLNEGMSAFCLDGDILGDAYEFLIGQFAAGSGKKAGEFYTPQEISSVLASIVTLPCQRTESKQTKPRKALKNILDFACGSGSLLLNVRKKLGRNIGKIYGQEKNITTYNLARMNMLLHGVKDTEFEMYHGDTLENDWDIFSEKNPARKITFDAVVANPPFSYRWEAPKSASDDFRFKEYGVAPKSAADFAFLLHGFHFLGKEGVMAIILPHGVLFRGGAESKIRKKLLEDGHIDTVISLPANLFYSTGIPVCVLVLKKCTQYDDILFINASAEENFSKEKRQNKLRPQDIEKLLTTYAQRTEEERYSRVVPMKEIIENDYNLNISRYISTALPEEEIDLDAVHKELCEVQEEIDAATKEHNTFLQELGLKPLV